MHSQVGQLKSSMSMFDVAVEERRDEPGVWTVEATDNVGDGKIYQALFCGPEAKERAYEYARSFYGTLR